MSVYIDLLRNQIDVDPRPGVLRAWATPWRRSRSDRIQPADSSLPAGCRGRESLRRAWPCTLSNRFGARSHAQGRRGAQSFRLVQVRISFYPFPAHDEPTDAILSSSYLPCVSDIPIVFRLPYEIFQEVLLNLPALPWTEVYHRHLGEEGDFRPASKMFWERAKALLALSATCRAVRQVVLMEAWKDYVMCGPAVGLKPLFGAPSQCEILLRKPHLASHVRCGSPFVYLESPDTSSDCLKDSGGAGRFCRRDLRSSVPLY